MANSLNQEIPAEQISELFIKQAVVWAQQFETFCILDNNRIANALNLQEIEFAMAVGVKDSLIGTGEDDWNKMKVFMDKHSGDSPVFGYLSYDLKNQLEKLSSKHPDYIGFAPMFFFTPLHLILIDSNGQLMVMSENGDEMLKEIKAIEISKTVQKPLSIHAKVSKEKYIETVKKIKEHILNGDVYELNYCVEFFAENTSIDPVQTYFSLQKISPTPFASMLKWENKYLISASPERFIKKALNKLFSQPIKGTIRRSSKLEIDQQHIYELKNSEKEKAENLMIVDLVRNDLAKSSEVGSVKVEELYGIYSFKQVHQMISTVSSTIIDGIHPMDAVENAFPMGSMTGAPKVMAMKLIENYEETKRGLYSGSVGYFAPNEDFDFNVVIRSIQYNQTSNYVNFEVGSAITFDSDPEQEYQECMLKASAMLEALNASIL
ncbi:MAG: anthranilate synthase component I family protein [Bacteroidia bacterium]|nr:anthranilate synthase component I family protein [Bacteroidia bacterium]MCF8428411.1 anthranilate synthase component I family protein [Bacteroidia bacterium]MCF8447616.1 anthranilate synthase component I family protein [Bacteroidia bacterium]